MTADQSRAVSRWGGGTIAPSNDAQFTDHWYEIRTFNCYRPCLPTLGMGVHHLILSCFLVVFCPRRGVFSSVQRFALQGCCGLGFDLFVPRQVSR